MNSLNASGKPTAGHAGYLLLSLAALLSISLTACAGGNMKGSYSKEVVQPVSVTKEGDGEAIVRFVVPLESMYYAAGLSYRENGDELQVAIDRCAVNTDCETMAKASRPLGEARTTEVRVPFHGKRITMIHSNSEQQIYP